MSLKKKIYPLNLRKLKEEEIQKFSLEKVIDKYNIYVTVVDLNQSDALRDAVEETSQAKTKDLKNQCFSISSLV